MSDDDSGSHDGPPIDLATPFRDAKRRLVEDLERQYLAALYVECRGNISRIARRLAMNRRSVQRMLRRVAIHSTGPLGRAAAGIDLSVPLPVAKKRAERDFERAYLARLLRECEGDVAVAARRAGVNRTTFYRAKRRLQSVPSITATAPRAVGRPDAPSAPLAPEELAAPARDDRTGIGSRVG